MLVEYLEKSAKELVEDLAEQWALPFVIEESLKRRLALRDAEILSQIEIERNIKEADTLPPEKEDEMKTRIDNSI
jgi:hypothetical protein